MADYFHEDERVVQTGDFIDYEKKIRTDICRTINWLYGTSDIQMERLKNYLLNLDKREVVDLSSERSRNVLNGVTEIVERISKGIQQLDPRLKGTLVSTGSSNNQTKIGDCDEFDFIYELNVKDLLQGKGTLKCYKGMEFVLQIDGEPDAEIVTDVWLPGEFVLMKDYVFDLFAHTLLQVLVDLELPEGWRHGGFNSPSFSWLHRQGPSYVLQFDFLNTCDNVPLCMSVDFVPMIRIRNQADAAISMLNQFLLTQTGMEHCWVSIDDSTFLHYGHAEELFLNTYPTESIPKKLIRISKALRIFLQIYSPKYPTKDYVKQVMDVRKQGMLGTKVANVLGMPVFHINRKDPMIDIPGAENYITFSDLGETIGNECMLKSYYIKRIVLLMMSVDESKGRGWTEDDLPDLVITVFRLMKNRIRRYCPPFPEIKVLKLKVYVPVEKPKVYVPVEKLKVYVPVEKLKVSVPVEKLKVSVPVEKLKVSVPVEKLKVSVPVEKLKVSVPVEKTLEATNPKHVVSRNGCQRCPKIYKAAKSSIKQSINEFKIPVRLIEGRLSSIFQLFQSVCEGQETAEIVYYKHYSDYQRDFPRQVTKAEYKEMLNELTS